MNKDAAGTTATDAAAPAIAESVAPPPLEITDAPPAPSDVIEISEHYETDDELAEFALDRFNAANAMFEDAEGDGFLEEQSAHTRAMAACAAHLLNSRALMRSAAALERQAVAEERAERHAADRRVQVSELHDLHMKVGRLQLSAIEGDVAKLREIAAIAFDFAQELKDAPLAEGDNGLSVIRLVPNDARCFVRKLELLAAQLTPGTVAG